ncbi:hypothetical protein HanLR1_Chr17g0676561 [Helianthus annuus]|nr:hypothetical protein HanLR1_Chr17g0676561 [Helianthus annuus]
MILNTSFLTFIFPLNLQTNRKSPQFHPQFPLFTSPKPPISMATTGAGESTSLTATAAQSSVPNSSLTLLFVEMGVGYDQHGQDVTKAAMKACRDAISSNSIPAFRRGTGCL